MEVVRFKLILILRSPLNFQTKNFLSYLYSNKEIFYKVVEKLKEIKTQFCSLIIRFTFKKRKQYPNEPAFLLSLWGRVGIYYTKVC